MVKPERRWASFTNSFKCLLSSLNVTPFCGSGTSVSNFICQDELCFSLELLSFSHISQLFNGATSNVSYINAIPAGNPSHTSPLVDITSDSLS